MDDLGIGVNATSAQPGVVPVAFVAVVEAVDADGERRFVTITSNGCTDERRARLLAELDR